MNLRPQRYEYFPEKKNFFGKTFIKNIAEKFPKKKIIITFAAKINN